MLLTYLIYSLEVEHRATMLQKGLIAIVLWLSITILLYKNTCSS